MGRSVLSVSGPGRLQPRRAAALYLPRRDVNVQRVADGGRQQGRNKGRAHAPGLKRRVPSVDLAAMPAKQNAGTCYGSIGAKDTTDLVYRIAPHLGSPRARWDAEAMELLWRRLDLSLGGMS